MTFKDPLVLALIPLFIILFLFFRKRHPGRSFFFPSDEIVKSLGYSLKAWMADNLVYLKVLAAILVIIALARPQVSGETEKRSEGIAIVLAIDCSSTMLAEDLQLGSLGMVKLVEDPAEAKRINRMDAVRDVAREFIKGRPDDMIGLVAFAAQAYELCPPTLDRDWLLKSLERVKVGIIKDATGIGSGILTSLNVLKDVEAKSRIIVLLTDGINNYGKVPSLVAAKAARALGIKIYTIGVSSKGQTPFPMKDERGRTKYENVKIEIDESVLREIASITGGRYYRVTNTEALKESYDDIDLLEKASLKQNSFEEHKDIFSIFAILAVLCVLAETLLGNTILRRIP